MADGIGAFVPGTDIRVDGAAEGPLKGLTFAAKDLFDVAGIKIDLKAAGRVLACSPVHRSREVAAMHVIGIFHVSILMVRASVLRAHSRHAWCGAALACLEWSRNRKCLGCRWCDAASIAQ